MDGMTAGAKAKRSAKGRGDELGDGAQPITITAPNMRMVTFHIIGTAPLVISRFPAKAMQAMMEKQAAGSTARGKKKRDAKDFDAAFNEARHISTDGWDGVHAGAFRSGMISACRLVNFKMTLAKMSVFVEPHGFDRIDGTPLVRILGPEPIRSDLPTRNATGVIDIRTRPMWREWEMDVTVRFDADQFTATDIANLMSRVGEQVGIGEGRADSKNSAGVGWGSFRIQERP
jgi:hypothetical protein